MKSLARQNVGNVEYPFETIGKLTKADPIRLQGNTYKGELHYVAEFIPAYNLAGLTFESRGTELDRNMAGGGESGEDVASGDQSSETDGGDIPEGITIHTPKSKPAAANGNGHHTHKSTDSTAIADDKASVKTSGTNKTTHTSNTAATVPPAIPEKAGLELSREDLFKNRT